MNVAKIFTFLAVVLFASSGYAATVYKWVAETGTVNFTDDYSRIPQDYRNKIETEQLQDYPSVKSPEPPGAISTSSEKMEGPHKDIYGMGPDYWKDKVRPRELKLKEAQDNIRAVDAKVQERINALSGRFLSHTQYNMNSIALQRLMEERARYEAEENGEKEMLQRITKEAEEAKADLSWLK